MGQQWSGARNVRVGDEVIFLCGLSDALLF